jgi:hypothetical protein
LIDFNWIKGHLISGRVGSGRVNLTFLKNRVGSGSNPGGFLGSDRVLPPLLILFVAWVAGWWHIICSMRFLYPILLLGTLNLILLQRFDEIGSESNSRFFKTKTNKKMNAEGNKIPCRFKLSSNMKISIKGETFSVRVWANQYSYLLVSTSLFYSHHFTHFQYN